MVGVQQHKTEIVAEIQGVVTSFRKQAIEQGVEKGCLFPDTVSTVHLMVADTRNEGNQPARGINHGAGVVADKSDAGLEGTAVVIAQVPPDNSKHGILAGCDDIIVKAGLVDPAIPTRHKGDCVVGLGWHGPESIGRRAPADFENMVPAWPQSGQLSADDLEEYGITEDSKAIQMLKLTQTFVLTDGHLSRISEMRRIFEEDKLYDQVFRQARLKADARQVLLCYKIQFRLRKIANEIEQKGQNKYAFVHSARYLLWALISQGLLNSPNLEEESDSYGTAMTLPAGYTELLSQIATTRVRHLLSGLMALPAYKDKVAEGNYSFLRTDAAFEKCMASAYSKWGWVHKKLQ